MVPSGYGRQTKLLLSQLSSLGHEVAVSAFHGLSGSAIRWEGHTILPAGREPYGTDVLVPHALTWGADLVLTLMDFWKLAPIAGELAHLNVAAWLPIDCNPLGKADQFVLERSKAHPIAMSQFGARQLTGAGMVPAFVPHSVDTNIFKPPADRDELRREIGVDDRFVIGICAANSDALRKAWPEQFAAFAKIHKAHPETLLMVHSQAHNPAGFNLAQLADDMGISDAVMMSEEYAQNAGLMPDEMMAAWFGALDVLSSCSYAEAFGVPLIEAQACGTPVIATAGSAMSENSGRGQAVHGSKFWNPVHRAWWTRPNVDDIVKAYYKAYRASDAHASLARTEAFAFAQGFDSQVVALEYWGPLLERAEPEPSSEVPEEEDVF
jgi:glycosyltransferase involved in cell wall biosynthesis